MDLGEREIREQQVHTTANDIHAGSRECSAIGCPRLMFTPTGRRTWSAVLDVEKRDTGSLPEQCPADEHMGDSDVVGMGAADNVGASTMRLSAPLPKSLCGLGELPSRRPDRADIGISRGIYRD